MPDATGGSSVVRSSDPSTKGAFDLSNETSTLQLLRAIHQSTLELDTKNMLRDTVFAFRAEKGAVVTAELAAMFSEHNFALLGAPEKQIEAQVTTTISSPQEEQEEVHSHLGMTRKRPQFPPTLLVATAASAHTKTAVEVPTSSTLPKESVLATAQPIPKATVTPTQEPVYTEEPALVPPVALASTAASEPSTVTPTTVASTPTQTQESVPVPQVTEQSSIPSPVLEPVSEVSPTEQKKQLEFTPADTVASSVTQRIKEIKHRVNEMVGNPVNLIDVHNEVGREYMNALLAAMKKSAGAPAGEQEASMQRLEAAFEAVQETMGVHNRQFSDAVPVEKKESTVPKRSAATPAQTIAVDGSQKPNFVQAPVTEEAVIKQNTVAKDNEVAVAVSQTPVSTVREENILPSVAKEKQVQEMMVAQKREAAITDGQRREAEIASMNPLMTPEVTAGLGQLLSEWSIFKHSGLFGTGPSGMDHPLYKKLSVVPMAAVVAGRFEGVTPQIKRSITDYMNGWRYEEGIMHEQGEAFETYLRRVIKHILQKRKVDSSASS